MLLEKKGLPDEGELVLCTVTKIYPNSIFAELDEYDRKTGMINISEIAPGRIRNIRDYVIEGKKIVCKILRIDRERGHIDLSLRRVNENQKRNKIEEIKQQQKTEKLVEDLAKKIKRDPKRLYEELYNAINKDYDSMNSFFIDVVTHEAKLSDYIKDASLLTELKFFIDQRVKPPSVEIKGEMTFYTKDPNGLETIKKIMSPATKIDDATLIYEGGGKYILKIKANNYKTAEQMLKDIIDPIELEAKKAKAHYEFKRTD